MERSVTGFTFLPFFFIFFFIALFLAVGILLLVWVYRDAKSRGLDGALWLLIVLVGNILGLIAYLIVREDRMRETVAREGRKYCSQCGHQISQDAKYCENCGKQTAN